MLQLFNGRLAGVFVKLIMAVLVISFGLWGVAEYFVYSGKESPDQSVVATAGESRIYGIEVRNAVQRDLQMLRAQFGQDIQPGMLKQSGFLEMRLQQLINDRLYQEEASRLGLVVTEEQKIREIMKIPGFRNADGQFDKDAFQRALQYQGMNEKMFFRSLQQDLKRQQILQSLFAAAPAPRELMIQRGRYEGQTMDVVRASIALSSFEAGAPGEAELQAVYEKNQSRFMTPEVRSFSYVRLRLQDAMNQASIDPAAVKAEYERRISEYTVPARRRFVQITLQSPEDAEDFITAYNNTKDIQEAIAETGVNATRTTLGPVDPGGVLSALSQEAFSVDLNRATSPRPTDFGWMVLIPQEEIPARVRPFEEVRTELAQALKEQTAAEGFFETISQIEEALYDENNLEGISRTFSLPVQQQANVLQNSQALPAPVIAAAFQTPLNKASQIIETENGEFYVVETRDIKAAQPRPLAEVREQIVSIWRREEQYRKASEIVDEIMKSTAPQDFAGALSSHPHIRVQSWRSLLRNQPPADLASHLGEYETIFRLGKGEKHRFSTADAVHVVGVLNITYPERPQISDAMQGEMEDTLLNEWVEMYQKGLAEMHSVQYNRQALDSLF